MKTLFQSFGMVLLLIILSSNVYSQNRTEYNLFTLTDNASVLNKPEMKKAVSDALVFTLNKTELQTLYAQRLPEITVNIPVSRNHTTEVKLQRTEIFAPGAKIVTETATGPVVVNPEGLLVSYTGKLAGEDKSMVVINFTNDEITGLMVAPDDNYIIGPVKDNGQSTDTYILYKENDLKIKNSFLCHTEDDMTPEFTEKVRNAVMNGGPDSPTDLYVAEIAIEVDFPTYNIYGANVTTTTNYVMALMSAASAVYMKEVNVRFVIPYLHIWTTTDPYSGTSSSQYLNQFRSYWNANMQSVQRTLAHFITRRPGNMGGIAWLNALCASPVSGFGYGFSNTDGPILPLPTYSWDVMVVCHEIGHNFGSNHTHNCGWIGGPIDSCYTVEGGCYGGPPIARVGTIMSYCHLNGSISLTQGFGPQPKALIRNNAESVSCMYVSARELVIGYPNGGETFRTGSSTQIYWGTSLTGNVNIEFSSNNGTSWQTIQSNVPAGQRIYDWTIPSMSTNLECKMRIINSSNPNSGDTCDLPFKIILNLNAFSNLTPPTLTRLAVSSTSTETQKFTWQRAETNPTVRYKFKIRKLGTTLDYIYTSDNNGQDSTMTLRKSFLDSLAMTLGVVGDSVRTTWRPWAFNGYDSLSSNSSSILTLVRTTVGINVISSNVPDRFSLGNNYPNPFNPSTNIKFDIANSTIAELKIFDSRGREIQTLVNEKLQPGSYEFSFDASNLPSGAYFYRLKTNEFSETKRMILLK